MKKKNECVFRPMYVYELIEKIDKLPEPKRSQTRQLLVEALKL